MHIVIITLAIVSDSDSQIDVYFFFASHNAVWGTSLFLRGRVCELQFII